jgi:hypothetical protein
MSVDPKLHLGTSRTFPGFYRSFISITSILTTPSN